MRLQIHTPTNPGNHIVKPLSLEQIGKRNQNQTKRTNERLCLLFCFLQNNRMNYVCIHQNKLSWTWEDDAVRQFREWWLWCLCLVLWFRKTSCFVVYNWSSWHQSIIPLFYPPVISFLVWIQNQLFFERDKRAKSLVVSIYRASNSFQSSSSALQSPIDLMTPGSWYNKAKSPPRKLCTLFKNSLLNVQMITQRTTCKQLNEEVMVQSMLLLIQSLF